MATKVTMEDEVNVKVNVSGLKELSDFLDKHGDKLQLVGVFELKPGDCLFFTLNKCISADQLDKIHGYLSNSLPGIKCMIFDGLDLVGVGRKVEKK